MIEADWVHVSKVRFITRDSKGSHPRGPGGAERRPLQGDDGDHHPVSAAFIALGVPIADPITAVLISDLILRTAWQA